MAINFSNALGMHEHTLRLRGQRSEVLASNIANADTPGYKARDYDFQSMLRGALAEQDTTFRMRTSSSRHIAGTSRLGTDNSLLYRVPMQASIDGNTVDEQTENAAFARNALEHQASFQFLNGKFTGLMKALRGE